jgi:hypothetical protein
MKHNMITYKDCSGAIYEKKYNKNIREIDLYGQNITQILNISGLKHLESLLLYRNQITEIQGLDQLTNLQALDLTGNRLKEIKSLRLEGLVKLNSLRLDYNEIIEINGLNGLTNLQDLWLDNNKIKKISGLDTLSRLKKLGISNNQIEEIEGIEKLYNLQNLWLSNNKITNVPFTIMNLRNLNHLHVGSSCNVDTIIERFINRNRIKDNKTIYSDLQNVHDSCIVKSIKESIYKIIIDQKDMMIDHTLKDIINDKILSEITKEQLLEYCQDKIIHSSLNLTFEEVLCSVWKIISEHSEQDEIKKILNEEMKDSICKCFTGRLSRLVNCLNGFDSRVSIKINDKEQILNVIIKIRNMYIDDIEKQKKETIKELTNRGYDKNIINEYIVYLE